MLKFIRCVAALSVLLVGCGGGGSTGQVKRPKWTVMVFLNASNDLYPYALPNVRQMSQVAYNPDVQFVLQWKESVAVSGNSVDFDGTRRYLVTPSTTAGAFGPVKLIQDLGKGVDMGKAQTLKDFVAWTKTTYPADRYVCVVWNHGNGWQRLRKNQPPTTRGVSYDNEFNTFIDTWDLPTAFVGQPVDVISFDACLMQMLEVASDLTQSCSYIATSEENTPGPGYPYQRVFKAFADTPNLDTKALLNSFVTGHIGYPPYQTLPVTQSVIDVKKVAALESAVDQLANALIAEKSHLSTDIPKIRSAAQKYGDRGDGRNYYDLVDLCQRLQTDPGIPLDAQNAASSVVTAVNDAVVWEGHSTLDSNSHGIGIDFSPSSNPKLSYYGNTGLAKQTHWLDWLNIAP